MTKIAIIVGTKGRGSNMRAIIEACRLGRLRATVAAVISPKAFTPAVDTAESLGAKVVVLDNFEEDLGPTLEKLEIDLVCLAGYMKLIPINVVKQYEGRMLNIHPALLPKFGGKGMWGMKVHEAVLAAGEMETGCTVHFVSERYDEGAILLQKKCEVAPYDTPESLAARVLALEHECYVEAIQKWLDKGL
jgi:formyltetrahydrofolate-dependent phosphoribosylglycinamide formyltransferase